MDHSNQDDHSNKDLDELVSKGKAQGYLTYDQVNDYLPDEAVNPEKLDSLLIALDEMGIELVTDAPVDEATLAAERSADILPFPAAPEVSALAAITAQHLAGWPTQTMPDAVALHASRDAALALGAKQ